VPGQGVEEGRSTSSAMRREGIRGEEKGSEPTSAAERRGEPRRHRAKADGSRNALRFILAYHGLVVNGRTHTSAPAHPRSASTDDHIREQRRSSFGAPHLRRHYCGEATRLTIRLRDCSASPRGARLRRTSAQWKQRPRTPNKPCRDGLSRTTDLNTRDRADLESNLVGNGDGPRESSLAAADAFAASHCSGLPKWDD